MVHCISSLWKAGVHACLIRLNDFCHVMNTCDVRCAYVWVCNIALVNIMSLSILSFTYTHKHTRTVFIDIDDVVWCSLWRTVTNTQPIQHRPGDINNNNNKINLECTWQTAIYTLFTIGNVRYTHSLTYERETRTVLTCIHEPRSIKAN